MAMIPAMTTGMMDFMMSSGRITDMAAMPVPLLAVPYAAPSARGGAGEKQTGPLVSFLKQLTEPLQHHINRPHRSIEAQVFHHPQGMDRVREREKARQRGCGEAGLWV